MSVVGLDLGNLNCFISVARQGGIEVATNDYSLHATPAVVQFGTKCRTMGVPAKNSMMSNLKNTVFNFKNLVGRKYSDSVVQQEIPHLPFAVTKLDNDAIGIKVDFLGESRVLTLEQITAILLLKLKESAEAFLKAKVYDCVVSVPSFWTDTQRRSLLDATRIAELNCLRIINETTAVALAYGIYKQDLPEEKEKPRLVAFVDVGHTATQASIVAFNKGKLKVLGTSYDLGFGGRAFDRLLRDHFTAEFKQKYKVDASSKPRPFTRLLDECEKLKKLMSANQQALPLNIECFMDDKDVTGKISRTEFEEMSEGLFPRFANMLKELFATTKIKREDLDSVEIVGGSSRVPRVKQIIRDVFGKEPSTTLNQDEAVSRGAALQCAIMSPTFRVREFSITDAQPYAIKLEWDGTKDAEQGEMIVFNENEAFPFSKMISFYRKEPFSLRAYYNSPNCIPYPTTFIGSFVVNNVVPDSTDGGSSRVKVKVRVNPNGLFLVSSASMYEKKASSTGGATETAAEDVGNENSEDQDGGNSNDKMDAGVTENGGDQDGTTKTGGDEKAQEVDGNGDPTAMDQEPFEARKAGKESSGKKQPSKNDEEEGNADGNKGKSGGKPKVKSVDLPVQENVPEFSPSDLDRFVQMERQMRKADTEEREKSDARNTLESYVYEIRDKITDGGMLDRFCSSQEKDTLGSMLMRMEDWIYDEGEDVEKHVYVDKLNELKKIGDPIVERQLESELRGPEWKDLRTVLVRTRKFVEEYMTGAEKYNHLDAGDVDKVRKCLDEKEDWCNRNEAAQNNRDPTLAPVVFASQIRGEREALERVVRPIQTKSKPKVEPPPQQQQEQQASSNGPSPSNDASNPPTSNADRMNPDATMEVD